MFVQMLSPNHLTPLQRSFSFWIGLAFISLGALAALGAVRQFRTVLRTLRPVEFPRGYRAHFGVYIHFAVAVLGMALVVYLLSQAPPL